MWQTERHADGPRLSGQKEMAGVMEQYTIGLDYGTLSARAALVDTATGREVASAVFPYPHAVIRGVLPASGQALPADFALQDPQDYEDALTALLSAVWRKAGVRPEQIAGIGVDFTTCTVLALDDALRPMCRRKAYRTEPHSYAKLWNHHGAAPEAERLDEVAAARGETFLARYGGKSSCEWLFPKLFETMDRAPELWRDTFCFLEASDWIVYLLTGTVRMSAVLAGYKAYWDPEEGYPSDSFFRAAAPGLERVVSDKLPFSSTISLPGTPAGGLSAAMAQATGLCAGTCVSVATGDAHAGVPASGVRKSGDMLLVAGTSLCQMLVSSRKHAVSGICGCVRDGLLPGFYGYEAGQPAAGDMLDWFISGLGSARGEQKAARFADMNEKAAALRPGQSGLLALDWWNGNRSVLNNAALSGMIVGLTLTTRPEEIYRALLEAAAFGTRRICEQLTGSGLTIGDVYACGGLSRKNPALMQVFSDVLQRPIRVSANEQAACAGAAIFAAAAAGVYADVQDASARMAGGILRVYTPRTEHRAVYDALYADYCALYDGFGTSELMARLRAWRDPAAENG